MAEENHRVVLHVYDLSQGLARQLSTSFLGKVIEAIWHTGVYVYGNEYYFGGGIQSSPGGNTPYGRPCKTIELGFTQIPKEMFEDYLQEISPRYTAQTYNLLHHNCNNFSEEVCQFLLGVGIPNYIISLPSEIMNSPMGALILPMIQQFETTLRYGGVPQVPHATGLQASTPAQNSNPAASPIMSVRRQSPSVSPSSSTSKEKKSEVEKAEKVGEARERIQNGITSEFASLMASGNMNASEAAVIATRKVMGLDSSNESKPTRVAPEKSSDTPKSEQQSRSTNVDKLGEAKARVQAEIMSEFSALMAEGTLRASEAAALATRRVMERHGRGLGVASQA